MVSSRISTCGLRWGLRWACEARSVTALAAATLALLALALALSTEARAHHRPAHIGVNPNPTAPVPDPVLIASGGLGGLNIPLPPSLPDEPDLIPIMPTESQLSGANVPALFIDTVQQPGKVLYRFDAVLGNIGGAFDLFCTDCAKTTQKLWQAIWPGGLPPGQQTGFSAPSGTTNHDLTAQGGYMIYSAASGHHHWHYDYAASYSLLIPGAATVPSVKIGFCMLDTYDTNTHFNYYAQTSPWCMSSSPAAPFVRMGISPGIGDYYNAQLADQWIDVTGVDAGTYTLRAEVNPPRVDINPAAPPRVIIEHDTSNNVGDFPRVIPGATAAGVALTTLVNQPVTVGLFGTLVGPEVQSRVSTCTSGGSLYDYFCYEDATGDTSLTFNIVQVSGAGALSPLFTTSDTTATITYTPAAGFVGIDGFAYTTTDSRGLTSQPATVTITIGTPPSNTGLPTVIGTTVIGETLSSTPGGWAGTPAPTLAHQWQRCDAEGANCVAIAGATGTTHVLSADEVGATLRVLVTATNALGSASAGSAVTAAITPLPLVTDPKSKIGRLLVVGSRFADFLNGTGAHELFKGLAGPDLINGRGGHDMAYGGRGRDLLKLGNGSDTAYGGKGPDTLNLGSGHDVAYGGRGADLLIGGKGRDKLYGGNGHDTFRVRDGKKDMVDCGNGKDIVIADAKDVIDESCETVKLPRTKKPA